MYAGVTVARAHRHADTRVKVAARRSYIVGSKLLRSQVLQPGALVLNRLFAPTANADAAIQTPRRPAELKVGVEAVAHHVAIALTQLRDIASGNRRAEVVQIPVEDADRLPLREALRRAALLRALRPITCVPPAIGTITSYFFRQVLFQVMPNVP